MSNISLTTENYNYWYSRIYGYFYRRVNTSTEARDLTCDTLSDFFTYSKEIENPQALIFKIAQNKLRNFIRNKSNTPFIEDIDNQDLDQKVFSYSKHYQDKMSSLVECAKKQLKNQHFQVLELSVLCDFSSQRVASELNLKPDNVRQILSRSIKKLREKCRQIWLDSNN
jgi:RNA polymerase sigma factor (sigma-70 family)